MLIGRMRYVLSDMADDTRLTGWQIPGIRCR